MRLGKFRLPRYLTTLLIAAVVATIAVSIWPPERGSNVLLTPLHGMEWSGYDMIFAWQPYDQATLDPRLVVLGYDSESERTLDHQWPPPRDWHAKTIDNMLKDGVRLIVFDVAFQAATTTNADKALDRALARAKGKVVLACTFSRSTKDDADVGIPTKSLVGPYWNMEQDIDLEANARIGFAEIPRDLTQKDNIFVRSFIPVTYLKGWNEPDEQGDWVPSLPTAAYLALHRISNDKIRVDQHAVWLGDQRIPRTGPDAIDPVEELAKDKHPIPSTYMAFPAALLPIVKFEQAYEGTFKPGTFKDKIVFIGITGADLTKVLNEQLVTAATHFRAYTRDRKSHLIAGVEYQAQVMNALLRNDYIHQLPLWHFWLIVFTYAVVALFVVRLFMNWRGPVLLSVVILAYIGVSIGAFNYLYTHIPWVLPSILVMLTAATLAWMERGSLKKKWAGYVSPAVMQMIMQHEGELGARRYEATVMFGDIRNFTGFSEKHTPETVVRLLNIHLEKLTKHIYDVGGTIDKFLGDGILAVFGAPLPQANSAVNAVRAAWLMREAANIPIVDENGEEYTLATGFGITTGPLVAGHVGSQRRHEFTIIGDTVNLASRLQGVTGKPDVIIDMPTYELVRDHVDIEPLGEVTLKGKSQPIACVKVIAWYEKPKATEPEL